MLGGAATMLYGMIGILGVKIWVQNKVNFSNPVNLTTAAVALIIGIADYTWTIGDLTFTGIALGSAAALVIYHGMKAIAKARGTVAEPEIGAGPPCRPRRRPPPTLRLNAPGSASFRSRPRFRSGHSLGPDDWAFRRRAWNHNVQGIPEVQFVAQRLRLQDAQRRLTAEAVFVHQAPRGQIRRHQGASDHGDPRRGLRPAGHLRHHPEGARHFPGVAGTAEDVITGEGVGLGEYSVMAALPGPSDTMGTASSDRTPWPAAALEYPGQRLSTAKSDRRTNSPLPRAASTGPSANEHCSRSAARACSLLAARVRDDPCRKMVAAHPMPRSAALMSVMNPRVISPR